MSTIRIGLLAVALGVLAAPAFSGEVAVGETGYTLVLPDDWVLKPSRVADGVLLQAGSPADDAALQVLTGAASAGVAEMAADYEGRMRGTFSGFGQTSDTEVDIEGVHSRLRTYRAESGGTPLDILALFYVRGEERWAVHVVCVRGKGEALRPVLMSFRPPRPRGPEPELVPGTSFSILPPANWTLTRGGGLHFEAEGGVATLDVNHLAGDERVGEQALAALAASLPGFAEIGRFTEALAGGTAEFRELRGEADGTRIGVIAMALRAGNCTVFAAGVYPAGFENGFRESLLASIRSLSSTVAPPVAQATTRRVFRDQALGIRFEVPESWPTSEIRGGNGVSFRGPEGTITLQVMTREAAAYRDLKSAVAEFRRKVDGAESASIMRETTMTVGGLPGHAAQVLLRDVGGDTGFRHLFLEHPRVILWFTFAAPAESFDSLSPHAEHLVESFRHEAAPPPAAPPAATPTEAFAAMQQAAARADWAALHGWLHADYLATLGPRCGTRDGFVSTMTSSAEARATVAFIGKEGGTVYSAEEHVVDGGRAALVKVRYADGERYFWFMRVGSAWQFKP